MSLFNWIKKLFGGKPEKDIANRLYVGNLNYRSKEVDLKLLFSRYGLIRRIQIIRDRATRRPKGYAFIEMSSKAEAKKALSLDGEDFMGRKITVKQAKPPQKREDRHPHESGSHQRSSGRRGGRRHSYSGNRR